MPQPPYDVVGDTGLGDESHDVPCIQGGTAKKPYNVHRSTMIHRATLILVLVMLILVLVVLILVWLIHVDTSFHVAPRVGSSREGQPEANKANQEKEKASTDRPPRPPITQSILKAAENKFTRAPGEVGFGAHGDIGGDRMSFNGYARAYEQYLTTVSTVASPTIAEIGILGCSGVAMWKELFPSSRVYGFDLNTTTCHGNFGTLKDRGFNDNQVQIVSMNQEADNRVLLNSLFLHDRLNIVIDDGYHAPQANINTFIQMKPFLADKFMYIVEDVYPEHVEDEVKWAGIWAQFVQACPPSECSLHLQKFTSYVVVLHHLHR